MTPEQWLEEHTIECAPYAARITPEQCTMQQKRGDRVFCPCPQAVDPRAPSAMPGQRLALLKKAVEVNGIETVAHILGNRPNTLISALHRCDGASNRMLSRTVQRFHADGTPKAPPAAFAKKPRSIRAARCRPDNAERNRRRRVDLPPEEQQKARGLLCRTIERQGLESVAKRLERNAATVRAVCCGYYHGRPDRILQTVLEAFKEEGPHA